MSTRNALARFFVILACAYLALYCYSRFVPYSLTWNITASIPKGIYFSELAQGRVLERGQVACFEYQAPPWAEPRKYFPPRFQLCKPILGMPGDRYERVGDVLLIARPGQDAVEVARFGQADSAGRSLPQDALTQGVLERDQYLLVAPAYTNSLDSRYLGPISRDRITRTLLPLITW